MLMGNDRPDREFQTETLRFVAFLSILWCGGERLDIPRCHLKYDCREFGRATNVKTFQRI